MLSYENMTDLRRGYLQDEEWHKHYILVPKISQRIEERRMYPACTNCIYYAGTLITRAEDAYEQYEFITGYACTNPKVIDTKWQKQVKVETLAVCPYRKIDARLTDITELLNQIEALEKWQEKIYKLIAEHEENHPGAGGEKTKEEAKPPAEKELKDVEFSDIL